MPRRRMTPARKAQIKKWQAAGAKARKARARKVIPRSEYGGKILTLYHRTSGFAAGEIAREGFKPGKKSAWGGYKTKAFRKTEVYASTMDSWAISGYGNSVVKFKANRHGARLSDQFPSGERHYAVNPKSIKRSSIKVLKGKRVR